MHTVTIAFGAGNPIMWALLFNDKNRAEESFAAATSIADKVVLVDDFGQQAAFNTQSIHAVMLEDLDKSRLAHCERTLHQARTQAKAQELAESDSILRAARARQAGSPVLMPVGISGNGGRQF
jgi:hypothetical protein